MSEEELNKKYIKNKIEGICQDCVWLDIIVPIIKEMLSQQYIEGLEQGKFDKEMDLAPERINLRNENLKLRNNWYELKKWLEEYEENSYGLGSYETGISDALGDVLKKMQKLESNND